MPEVCIEGSLNEYRICANYNESDGIAYETQHGPTIRHSKKQRWLTSMNTWTRNESGARIFSEKEKAEATMERVKSSTPENYLD